MMTKISVGSDHLFNKEFKTKLLTTNDEKNSNDSKNCKAYWYWSLLTQLLKYQKIPLISPLCHENKFATDFKKQQYQTPIAYSIFSLQSSGYDWIILRHQNSHEISFFSPKKKLLLLS